MDCLGAFYFNVLRLEVFICVGEMAEDSETKPNLARQCQSIVIALSKMCSAQVLLKAQPSRQIIRLPYTRHDDEAPVEVVCGEKSKGKRRIVSEKLIVNRVPPRMNPQQPPSQKIDLMYTGHDDEAPAKVVFELRPKRKRLLVPEELKMSHVLLAKELRSMRQRI